VYKVRSGKNKMKKMLILILIGAIFVAMGVGFVVKIGSDYGTCRGCMGMFPVLYSFYRDAEISTKDRRTFQIHSWGALRCIEESSWISRKTYRLLNPRYSVDPSSGELTPQWFSERSDVEPSDEQVQVLQSLFDHELAISKPSLEELRSIVVL